jgi:hypothetical protein
MTQMAGMESHEDTKDTKRTGMVYPQMTQMAGMESHDDTKDTKRTGMAQPQMTQMGEPAAGQG